MYQSIDRQSGYQRCADSVIFASAFVCDSVLGSYQSSVLTSQYCARSRPPTH